MSKGQLSFVLGLKVGAQRESRKTCYQMVLMVVKFFEIGIKIGVGKFVIVKLQSNSTWLQWNVLIIYSYIITGEGKFFFQIKGSRNAVVTES